MKVNKLITLDTEIMEKLKGYKEMSHSALINQLLTSYFMSKEPMTLEEKEKKLLELKAKYEYEKQLEKIKNEFNTGSD